MSEVVLKVAMACEVRWRLQIHPPPRRWYARIGLPPLAAATALHLIWCHPDLHPEYTGNVALCPGVPQGCVGAVRRVAEKLEGVQAVDIDLPSQKVGSMRRVVHAVLMLRCWWSVLAVGACVRGLLTEQHGMLNPNAL